MHGPPQGQAKLDARREARPSKGRPARRTKQGGDRRGGRDDGNGAQASEALGDAPDEVCEGFGRRRSEGRERDAGIALGKHAVGGDDMNMDMQVERAAEAPHDASSRDGQARRRTRPHHRGTYARGSR
jgi:hypothetical protein